MNDGRDGRDGRRHPRYAINWAVEVRAEEWRDALELATQDISRGGLFVRATQPPAVGTRLAIAIHLPDGSILRLEGIVVHAVSAERAAAQGLAAGFGLRFDEQHATDLVLLEAVAASNVAGRHTTAVDERCIAFAARLLGDGAPGESTTAYQLVSPSATDGEVATPSTDAAVATPSTDAAVATSSTDAAPGSTGAVASGSAGPASPPSRAARADATPSVFGIDFGTSFTSIALFEDRAIRVLSDDEGQCALPSVVCYLERGAPLVGWPAREKIATAPSTTFTSPKRLLGRRFDDRDVEPLLATTPVRLRPGPSGEIIAEVYGEPLALPQICAEILRRIAAVGARAAGRAVQRVVLSAPVTFGQVERLALLRAAEIAGLQVLQILDEPVAAALASGIHTARGLVAIYDFGGGTFDFALLRLDAEGRVVVVAQAGDAWLGGDDFDLALANHAADAFWRQRRIDLRERQVEFRRLLFHCEAAKRRLSFEQSVELVVPGILLSIAGPIDLRLTIDRAMVAELCAQLIDRSLETVRACLEARGIAPRDIDRVVLTGGMCRLPQVRERVQQYFQREIGLTTDPELAIVSGNALWGRVLAQRAAS